MDKKILEIPKIKKYMPHLVELHNFYRIGNNDQRIRIFDRANKLLTNLEAYGFDRKGFLEPLLMFGWEFILSEKHRLKINSKPMPEATQEEVEEIFGSKTQDLKPEDLVAIKEANLKRIKEQSQQQSLV